jgi:uncharacterized protein
MSSKEIKKIHKSIQTEIFRGINIVDLGLFVKKEKILILSDMHIGQEAAMNKDGLLIPRFSFKDLISKTQKILEETNPKIIILNGDVKHEFGGISREEWKHTLDYLDILLEYGHVVIIKGNHDKIIAPIAERKGIPVVDFYSINSDAYVCHGDVIPQDTYYNKSKIVIIGHEHPAVGLRDGNRVEKYKCFLKGTYGKGSKAKTLIVMPSMNSLTEGTDVLSEKLLSPFLHQNLANFEVWIVENKVFYFGKLKGLPKE